MNILFEIPDKILIIIGIIAVLLITIGVILFKVFNRKKIKPIEEEERYDAQIDDDDYMSLTVEDFFDDKRVSEEDLTEEQKEAKEELQRVFEKMSNDLEKQSEKVDEIDEFEREQEEDAIISYQELMERADTLKREADEFERMSEIESNMKVEDVLNSYESRERNNKKNSKKFKNSDIISPIYGVQSNKNMVRIKKSREKIKKNDIISKAYEKDFDEEKTQNLEFLKTLREFRKNL